MGWSSRLRRPGFPADSPELVVVKKKPLNKGRFLWLCLDSDRLFQYLLQAGQQLVAGVVHMPFADGKGARFVARRNGRSQFFMFVPDGQTLFCRLQYRPHDTPQVYPMNLCTLGDHGVARRFVNCFVKGFVGFDHGAYVMTTSNLAAQTDQVRVQYG